MKNLINIFTIFLIFFSANLSAQTIDTLPKEKVIYPVAQASDTVTFLAAVAEINQPLIVKEYIVITDFYIFEKSTGKNPQPFRQTFRLKSNNAIINDFMDRVVWSKEIKKTDGKR